MKNLTQKFIGLLVFVFTINNAFAQCQDGDVLDCDGSGECHPTSWISDGYCDGTDQQYGANLSCYEAEFPDCGYTTNAPSDWGCTDSSALNYNPNAVADNGGCIYTILGCMDSSASNFNPNAIEDDGSCCFTSSSTFITLDGGQWQEEISWSITDCDDNVLIEGGAPFNSCIEQIPSDATINMVDSYGDGWNGNILTIGDLTYTLVDGSEGISYIGQGCNGGCTDPFASNYNIDAFFDDGSCENSNTCFDTTYTSVTSCSEYNWYGDIYSVSGTYFTNASSYLTQVGNDIEGYQNIDMGDENSFVIGLPLTYEGANNFGGYKGSIKMFHLENGVWEQKGEDIIGPGGDAGGDDTSNQGDQLGGAVAMGDQNTIAASSRWSDFKMDCSILGLSNYSILCAQYNMDNAGVVRVYNFNGSTWEQKGSDIWGEETSQYMGDAIEMPDANTLAIGSTLTPMFEGRGRVEIYSWNGESWMKSGGMFGTDPGDHIGDVFHMPDANTIAIGSRLNDLEYASENFEGEVTVWHKTEGAPGYGWSQKGQKIYGDPHDRMGTSVSMGNANTYAVVSYGDGNPNVKVFQWTGDLWSQKGEEISFELNDGISNSILKVSMSGANTFSMNVQGNIYVYKWQNNQWILNETIDGDFTDVDMPNHNIIGTPNQIYELQSDTEDGACDSILVLDLSISPSEITGCTDSLACNYNPNAVCDDNSCSTIYGCTDPDACNYNPDAGCDDGSCFGLSACMDEMACNFNEFATCDDGSCQGLLGCVDQTACNFDANATCDDGSCQGLLGCMSESACNFDANATCDDISCVFPGCMDPLACNFDPIAACDDGSCDGLIGCNGQTAINFNPNATCNDGTCEYNIALTDQTTTCAGYITDNGGSNGNYSDQSNDLQSITIYPETAGEYAQVYFSQWELAYGIIFSIYDGENTNGPLLYQGFDNGNGDLPYSLSHHNDWELSDEEIFTFTAGAENPTGALTITYIKTDDGWYTNWGFIGEISCSSEPGNNTTCTEEEVSTAGCTDPLACNYDSGATCDNTSCSYGGCTDPLASNYDENAACDDGSCLVDCDHELFILNMYDSSDDGWDGNTFEVAGQSLTLESGSEGTAYVCLDMSSCNTITVGGSSWQEEVSWTLGELSGGAPYDGLLGDCGSVGCTDFLACNYDNSADQDNGTCVYPAENFDCDGNEYACADSDNGASDIDGDNCSAYTANPSWCANSSNYDDDDFAASEMCCICGGGTSYMIVYGCTDSTAENYNPEASIEDFSCIYPLGYGCTDSTACNYDTSAEEDNGTCDYPQAGYDCNGNCANGGVSALYTPGDWAEENSFTITDCEGNLLAEMIVGSSEFSNACLALSSNYSINLIDSYGDGWNGGSLVVDGTSYTIDEGYEANFIIGSCGVVGCTDDLANNYNPDANVDDGSCTYDVLGCTDVNALNYNPDATIDDGSCQSENDWPSEQIINLPEGWSMFSTYMYSENPSLDQVLSPVFEDIVIAKDYLGNAYLPDWNFNAVGDISTLTGYQIKMNNSRELSISGEYVIPEENPVLFPEGWYIMGYLRLEGVQVDVLLSDLVAEGYITIVKDYLGNAYLPEWDFNAIGNIQPGYGYQIKTNQECNLNYLSNNDSYRLSIIDVTNNEPSHFLRALNTDHNMTILIEDIAWDIIPSEGSEISAYDQKGNLVGSTKYTSPTTLLTVWGDDELSTLKDGLIVNENISFKLWDTNSTYDFEVVNWKQGSSFYSVNAINIASSIQSNNFANNLEPHRVLLRVINILGQEVEINKESFTGSVFFEVFNDGSVEKKFR